MSDNINIRIALTGAAQVQSGLKAIGSAASMLKSALVPLAGAFGVSRIAEEFNRINSEMAKLGNSAQTFGVSTEFLSSFGYAAKVAGVESAKLGEAMKGFVEKSRSSGVAVGDLSDELMRQADVFSKTPDGPQKAALAMQTFGEAGLSIIPVLNKGGNGLRDMADEAKRFGLVVDTDAARAAKAFKMDVERLDSAFEGLKIQITKGAIPAISDMAKVSLAAISTAAGKDTGISQILKVSGAYAAYEYQKLTRNISAATEGLVEAVDQVFSKDKRMSLGDIIKAASKGVDEFDEKLRKLRSPVEEVKKTAEIIEYGPFRSGVSGPNVISGRMPGLDGMTEVQKRDTERERARNRLLALDRQIAALESQNPNIEQGQSFTEDEQLKVTQQLVEYRQKMAELRVESEATAETLKSLGGSETSMVWNQTIIDLQNQWGSLSGQLASTFANTFNTAVSSISSGLTSVIMQTKSWGEALAAIGNTILTSVVNSIIQMGVRWVMTQILMATVGKTIAASSLAANAGIASAQSAVWATPATLATIASYGSAAAMAPGAIAVAQGAVMAGALAAFKAGGYTGDGDPNQVAGVVHRGEYVVPASAVRRIGIENLDVMRSGGGAESMPVAAAPGGTKVNLATFDNRRDADQWAQSQDAETWFVDMSKRTAHRWQKS